MTRWWQYGRNRNLVFLHIPRTGGTTLEHVLRTLYHDSYHSCDDPAPSAIAAMLRRYRCLELHTGPVAGETDYFTRDVMQESHWDVFKRTRLFVLFRDPVRQFVSMYRYLFTRKAEVASELQRFGRRFPDTIEEWMAFPPAYNIQLAFLVGKYQHPRGGNVVNRTDLAFAKRLLGELDIQIGLTERYAESLHVLATATGRRISDRPIGVRNAMRHPPETYDDDTLRRIAEGNALDRELYEYARTLFEAQLATCGPVPQYCFHPEIGLPSHLRSEGMFP